MEKDYYMMMLLSGQIFSLFICVIEETVCECLQEAGYTSLW